MKNLGKVIFFTTLSLMICRISYSQELILSHKVPNDQKKAIQRDIKILSGLSFRAVPDQKTLDAFETKTFDTKYLTKWLFDRVQVIIEDKSTNEFTINVKDNNWPFENPGLIPTLETSNIRPSKNGVVAMSNTGTGLYYLGKSQNNLLEIEVPTSWKNKVVVPITSPRAGIIKIGKGLFQRSMKLDRRNDNAKSNSLMRLAIFFHEARHSDGNGESMGFYHGICPKGHTYEGHSACDRTTNGAYTIGSQMLKEFLKNCSDCSETEKEILRLKYLDNLGRIFKDAVPVDAKPEGKRSR
jgi:hypothetical protein